MRQEYDLILGSKSPRRKFLVDELSLKSSVFEFEVDESYPDHLLASEVPLYLAELKAKACPLTIQERQVLITADTVVLLKDRVLGKPKDVDDARNMLTLLSGETHQVVTGVCLSYRGGCIKFSESTDVTFYRSSNEDVEFYIKQFSPFDKAGSYGIQDWWGLSKIKAIKGCYYNVMGLPTSKLYRELIKIGALV